MFLPGLKASTSRQASLSLLPGTVRPIFDFRKPIVIRHASSSTHVSTQALTAEQEKQVAEQERKAKMMPRVDFGGLVTPILEPIVDPPWNPWWFFRRPSKGMFDYLKARATRWVQTRQMLTTLIRQDVIGVHRTWIKLRSISVRGAPMLEDALEVYKTYNAAQARGESAALRSLSSGKALDSALSVSKQVELNRRKMTWEYLRERRKPKIISVRFGSIDPAATKIAAQIVVKFDSDQALTTYNPTTGKPNRKASRVVEHCLFERKVPEDYGWRLKDKLQPTLPPFVVEADEAAKTSKTT